MVFLYYEVLSVMIVVWVCLLEDFFFYVLSLDGMDKFYYDVFGVFWSDKGIIYVLFC